MNLNKGKNSIKDLIWKYLCSMKVGIILLIIVAILSIFGTLIPQGAEEEVYYRQYSETVADIILFTGMDNVFETWWYLLVGGLLCVNLLACSINRFPGIYRGVFSPKKVKNDRGINNLKNQTELFLSQNKDKEKAFDEIETVLKQEGFKIEHPREDSVYASKGRFGYFGSFITHISFLILILAFMYGNLTGFEDSVGGVPGETISMNYADFDLKVEDFRIDYRDDYSVDQYYSDLTILENGEETKTETIYVNRPLRHDGLNFYQSSYGWVGSLRIEDEEKFFLDTVQVFEDRSYRYRMGNLTVHLEAFYPDYGYDAEGSPVNKSPYPNNPRFIWYLLDGKNELVDMMVSEKGETYEYENVEFTFTDYDQYTVLRVVRDPSVPIFYFGSVLMMVGLILSFFFAPRRIWVNFGKDDDGNDRILIGGQSFKSKAQFEEDFKEIINIIIEKVG